jgi:NAD(P) transhydrogenase subunit alpha
MDRVLPMMMTPAGTIAPSRVFVIGVGVAGLQAIATAKRLGARVDAFDTRPVVEEQVKSLGAKFVKVDLGETGQTRDGYAKELTAEQQQKQRDAMAKVCAQSDLVITTAQLFGKKAPLIVTKEMIDRMKPGSVIVDLAVESGGNVEGSMIDREIVENGVRIIGLGNLPGHVAINASQMYSSNMSSFIEAYWNEEDKKLELDWEDEIIKGCVITHDGVLQSDKVKVLEKV